MSKDMNVEQKTNDIEQRKFSGSIRPIQETDLPAIDEILRQWLINSQTGELINAYVHKDLQGGGGVGTALLNTIEGLAKTNECTEVILDSGPRHRLTGHPFYIKKGYEKAGMIPDYYGLGGDTTVFRREI